MQHLRVMSPAPRDVWHEVHAADSKALVTQRPDWLDCLCEIGGYEDASRFYETRDGRRFILPLVRRLHLPQQLSVQASFPSGWGFGGLIASHPLGPEDVALVLNDLAGLPGLRTSVRPNPLEGTVWALGGIPRAVVIQRRAHVLDLGGGFGYVWSRRFEGSARTGFRKAERRGVRAECDSTGRLVSTYYELYERSLERWAEKQHEPLWLARWRGHRRDPLRKFEALARALGEAMRVWVAWVDGQPAAAIVVLMGRNAHDTRGVMDFELAAPSRANDLIQTLAIQSACNEGCRHYHMGESGSSTRIGHYKYQFGAEAYPYPEYRLEPVSVTKVDTRLRAFAKSAIGFRELE